MFTKTIKYEDFNGEMQSESFMFHLSEPDLMRLDAEFVGGIDGVLKAYEANPKNTKDVMRLFEEAILRAYGVKSPDGKQFVKTEDVYNAFRFSGAYPVLFKELLTDTQNAQDFINALVNGARK
mgnify:CR=1 FL=1